MLESVGLSEEGHVATSGARTASGPRVWVASILATAVLTMGLAGAVDAAGAVVNITDYGFAPSPVTITVGETVTWVNKGAVPHWVEPGTGTYGGGFTDSPRIPPGGQYTAKFSTIGTFNYQDALYPFMGGTVVVKSAPAPTPKPTARPTAKPTARPTAKPTAKATAVPAATAAPTSAASAELTPAASDTGSTGTGTPGSDASAAPSGSGGDSTGSSTGSAGGSLDIGSILFGLVLAVLLFFAWLGVQSFRRNRPGPPASGPWNGPSGAGGPGGSGGSGGSSSSGDPDPLAPADPSSASPTAAESTPAPVEPAAVPLSPATRRLVPRAAPLEPFDEDAPIGDG